MSGPPEQSRNRSAYTGGADAVNDTPATAGHGTEPGHTERRAVPRSSGTGSRGLPMLGWLAIVLAVALLLFYGFGVFGFLG